MKPPLLILPVLLLPAWAAGDSADAPRRRPKFCRGRSEDGQDAAHAARAARQARLLFGTVRGLRKGEWKITSFEGCPWELSHLLCDRMELHDLAGKHPEILTRMVAEWHRMAVEVLQAPPRGRLPVAATARDHEHPEWTTSAADPAGGDDGAGSDGFH